MIRTAVNLSKSATSLSRIIRSRGSTRNGPCFYGPPRPPLRPVHDDAGISGPNSNPVTVQMINYALSHARSQKSEESYAQGLLILEQCLSTQPKDGQCAQNWRGITLLAMSTLLYERGNLTEAIEKLQGAESLKQSSLGVRVAAMEALAGIHLQLGQDDTSSMVADKCLDLLKNYKAESGEGDYVALGDRTNAIRGLVMLIRGDLEAAQSFFQRFQEHESCTGSAALSYGEYLHATRNFALAKEFYQKVIEILDKTKDFSDMNALGSCNMVPQEVSLAANFSLGQLEAHMGNFGNAEEVLTRVLTKTEELFGGNHPKVGVVLTCLALMFRNKAKQERSSALLIQEGLYRRAIEFLKAPPLESEGSEMKGGDTRDMVALARGGYAEALCVQENRRAEGERMKKWAEAAWKNQRMSLAEAMDFSEPSDKVLVIDGRTSRAL